MDKKITDYLHLYLGCEVEWWNGSGVYILDPYYLSEIAEDDLWEKTKPILRPLSDMTDEEILQCGKFICAVPNEEGFSYEIQRFHNTVGAKFYSGKFTSGQYLSIWNEKNKVSGIGHIEVGWYSDNKIDKRRTKELWKVGGCHELTVYLLSKHFDLFGLIESGLAIDKTKQ